MTDHRSPLVSIGIPVYNGDNYLQFAIESVLGQTYSNLELIISDNASSDNTMDICRKYLELDDRITYVRNRVNHGAGPNYDNCFYRSAGKYFKWLAHDDMVEKDYIELAVAAMENKPEAALCFSQIRKIDNHNKTIEILDPNYTNINSFEPDVRFGSIISELTTCEIFFSLIRRDVLVNSELHGNYISSDKVLLAEMALRGPFLKIERPLLIIRDHEQRYSKSVYPDRQKALKWFDAESKGKKPYRRITLYKQYIRIIKKNIIKPADRIKCYIWLLKYMLKKRNMRLMLHDLVLAISPWLYYRLSFISEKDRTMR